MKKLLAFLMAVMLIMSVCSVSISAQGVESADDAKGVAEVGSATTDEEPIELLKKFLLEQMGGTDYLANNKTIKKYTLGLYGAYSTPTDNDFDLYDLNFTYNKKYADYFGTASLNVGDCIYSNVVHAELSAYLGLGYYIVLTEKGVVMRLEDALDMNLPHLKDMCFSTGFGRKIGDLDNDRQVTVKDATRIQKIVAGVVTENFYGLGSYITVGYISIYDFDGNGNVDVRDSTNIQKYIAGLPFNFDGNINVTTTTIPETAMKLDCNIVTGCEVWDDERYNEMLDYVELFTSAEEYAAASLEKEDIYDEKFFESNNLVFVHKILWSGSFGYKVRGVYAQGDTLYVDTCIMDVTPGSAITDDMNYLGIYIEIPKSSAPDAQKVVKFTDTKYFPGPDESNKDYYR